MKFKLSYLVIAVLSLAVIGGGFFGYQKYSDLKKENQRLSNPEEAAKTDIEKTKSQVEALIEVPADEEPTIANVVDVTKLTDQPFFKNAKNGDRLLVYQKAKKAILYRPETNKIVEVSTINIGADTTQKTTDTSKTTTKSTQATGSADNTSSVDAGLPGLAQ